MDNEQKMREALGHIASFQPAEKDAFKGWQEWNRAGEYAASIAREALASPAGEQVGLTDGDDLLTTLKMALPHINPKAVSRKLMMQGKSVDDCYINTIVSRVIAAHEAKRASCSQTAKKSTCEVGRVDETGKSEHVGGAA